MKILNSNSINTQYTNLVNKTISSIESIVHFICNQKQKNILIFDPVYLITGTSNLHIYNVSLTSNQEIIVNIGEVSPKWIALIDPQLQLQDLIQLLERLEKL